MFRNLPAGPVLMFVCITSLLLSIVFGLFVGWIPSILSLFVTVFGVTGLVTICNLSDRFDIYFTSSFQEVWDALTWKP